VYAGAKRNALKEEKGKWGEPDALCPPVTGYIFE